MEKVQKISTAQFFSLLLLSRLLTTLTFMPVFEMKVNNLDYIVAILLGSAVMLLFLLPMYYLFKNSGGKGAAASVENGKQNADARNRRPNPAHNHGHTSSQCILCATGGEILA